MAECLHSPVGRFLKSERNEAEDAPFDVIQDTDRIERPLMIGMSGIMRDSNARWQANSPQGQGIKTSDSGFDIVERLLDIWLDTDTWKIVGSIKMCMYKRAELEHLGAPGVTWYRISIIISPT